MWLKSMCQWLEKSKPISEERLAEQLRIKRENDALELRKAEVSLWFCLPPC